MPDFVLGNISTTAAATLNVSLYGDIDTAGDHDWYQVRLLAGQTYEFRLHGIGTGELHDPEVRIRDAAGNQLAINDDAGATRWDGTNNLDSYLEFTAATTGTYFIDVGGHGDDETGRFLLTAATHGSSGMVFTPDEISWQSTNNYQDYRERQAAAWDFSDRFAFALTVNISTLSPDAQFLAQNAFRAWTAFSGIGFIETTGAADITFDDDRAGVRASTDNVLDGDAITSSAVHISQGWLDRFGTGIQSYSFEIYIHEIGHALGLGHTGNYNSDVTYGTDNYYANDSLAYSIMSYFNVAGDEFTRPGTEFYNPNAENRSVDADFRYMLTPGVADYISIRNLYPDLLPTIRPGDTTYGFNSNTGNAALDMATTIGADMFMTIVDSGGIDTLNFSNTSAGQVIDLNAEASSNVLGGATNLWIARGVQIENAYGGSGEDILIGNAANNILDGGGGVDEMYGGAGDDTFYVDNASDIVEEFAGNGAHDRINVRLTTYTLPIEVEELNYVGPNNFLDFHGTGNTLDNLIIGWSGNDTLDGKQGADTMRGLSGNDNYYVDNVGDVVVESVDAGNDRVDTTLVAYTLSANVEVLNYDGNPSLNFRGTGNALNNIIQGYNGNDILDGQAGADTMRGYFGDDLFYVDNISDVVIEVEGRGSDTVASYVSYVLAAGQWIETLKLADPASTSPLNLTGNELGQRLLGNAGANLLDGGGGADNLYGFGGNDTYAVDVLGDRVFEIANAGNDRVNASVSYTLQAGQSVETLALSNAASTAALDLTGNELGQRLVGNAGANLIDGKGGADNLYGLGGNDTYRIDNVGDLVFETADAGTDRVEASLSYRLGAGQSVETLALSNAAGTQAFYLVGNELGQRVLGNAGANLIDGGGGIDILYGLGGPDTFRFSTAFGRNNIDRIADYSVADDTIRLDRSIFSALDLGALSAGAFKDISAPGAVVDANDHILYDHDTGALFYDSNGSAAGGRYQFVTLDNRPATLTAGDFFVVA